MTRTEERSTATPWWAVWAVGIGILAAVAVTLAVDASEPSVSLDPSQLDRHVLQSADGVLGLDLVQSFGVEDYEQPTVTGADDEFASIFSSTDLDVGTPEAAIRGWSLGSTVVVSEALTFGSSEEAIDHLDVLWADHARGAVERQRGPDGSLLMFHPTFDRNGRAPEVPVAIAAWAVESEVLVIRHAGADSSSTVLELARILDRRLIDEWAVTG